MIVRLILMFWFQKDKKLIGKKGPEVVSNRSDDKTFTFATQRFYRLIVLIRSQHDGGLILQKAVLVSAQRTSGR